MEVARKARPSLLQSNTATFLLLCLSILTLPVTLLVTLAFYAYTTITGTSLDYRYHSDPCGRGTTVLVTGARANKALTLCRAFKKAGCTVILAEEAKWGTLTCARFSRAVDHFHILPDPANEPDAYISAIQRLVRLWNVGAWVPCSSVHATMVDSEAAQQIAALSQRPHVHTCEPFIPFPEVCGTLHWKDQFEDLCIELGYPVPESKKVTSVDDAVDFLHSTETLAKGHKYLLKSLSLDDLGRDDFTLFPLRSREETTRHLSGVPTPLSEKHPFLLQRFLFGNEYCTHVAARDGAIVAFVACRSNQLLMRYGDVRNLSAEEKEVGERLEAWSQEFLDRYKAKLGREGKTDWSYALTGHFSFDFIVEDGVVYVLECNVRAHTAVALFSDHPSLAEHYLGTAAPTEARVARPDPGTAPRSWLAHALPLALCRLLPRRLCALLHPQLLSTIYPSDAEDPTTSPPAGESAGLLLARYAAGAERDGIWDSTDPVPFLVLCHVQWPWLLLRLVWRGVPWSRVNVSTSRVFEC
ncbi:hypothetical protein PsYK624_074260 [Phanerochaete sordida]|uniref:ATP-grasp domain-containing protein n=1 Tax=Phanerochaete sordida TaxID=48140 RepID=A0A9P3GAX6_9APHY|nr:hypothetical protein PsYK624_074260 [Phanerochaete sordida]